MYPPQFDYYRPASVAEALLLQKEHDGKYLAGGHSLIPVMKLRLSDPGVLIDIGRLNDLKGIDINGNMSSIRALTTYAEIEKAEGLPDMVTEAVGWIGDQMVRNRGTIGGSIAHADPASDMPTVLTALNAVISTVGSDATRRISADDFFTGLFETDLSENEIVAEIEF
ncbi:MAG: FAD binding domain-containing protein, partial [Chloroflexota bacterium]